VITALIIMYFFGGGTVELFSSSDFRTIGRSIEDSSRAAVATRAMERINENLASVFEQRNMSFEQLAEINADVDAPEDAYEKVLDELWKARGEARRKYVQDIFIMRRNMTRHEWDIAFGNAE